MRRMMGVLSVVGVLAVTISAQGKFNLRIAAANGKAAANLPVVMSMAPNATPVGTTDKDGDLDVASDPNKNGQNYNVYRLDCNRIVILREDSADDRDCKKQSAESPPSQDGCGRCVPMGAFVWGRSTVIGHFAGDGSAWKNPWVIGSLIGAGVAVPVAISQGGSNAASSTATAGPAPAAAVPPTPTPTPTPAPPPAPPSFTVTNASINFTATQNGQRTCNLIAPTYQGTGTYTVDASGRITLSLTDPTNITQVYSGTGTFASATSLIFSSLGPFNFSSSTGRNYQGQPGSGTASPTGGSFALSIFYQGGGPAGPAVGCSDPFTIAFNRP